jgi:hypothetical protein
MMRYPNSFCLIFILVLFATSCSNLCIQKSVFVPLTEQKGDTRIEASSGREAININTAYALTNHLALQLNGMTAIDKEGRLERAYNRQLETAIGYYLAIRDSFHFKRILVAAGESLIRILTG